MTPDPAVVGSHGLWGFNGDDATSFGSRQHHVRERVREGVASVRHAASETAHSAREQLGRFEDRVSAQAQRAKVAAEDTFDGRACRWRWDCCPRAVGVRGDE
jgi:hypothetical protein